MMDTTVYVGMTKSKDFFNIPPEKRKNNEFFQKKEEKTMTEQILNKVFPGLSFSKSKVRVNNNEGDPYKNKKRM